MSGTMRRWELSAIGRGNLSLAETAIPTPAPGEALVRVAAVSLNYRDKLVVESGMGLPLTFPLIPASDMAGTIVAVGDGATRFQPGSRVISTFSPGWIDGKPKGDARTPPYRTLGGIYPGVLSEYVAFPEDWLAAAPCKPRRCRGQHPAVRRADRVVRADRARQAACRPDRRRARHRRGRVVRSADRQGPWR